MTSHEIRAQFLKYMQNNGHAIIPSASLVPENDPTTLFTGSGMQPLLPYLLGKDHPQGSRLADSQKCFRAEDIEEIGDNRHTTFFEMLGNWSLGDYFKKEQLSFFFHFLVDEVGIDPSKLYVTVFAGDDAHDIGTDEESITIWKELFASKDVAAEAAHIGSEKDGYKKGMKEGERIFAYTDKNWWSRSGAPANMPAGEPGGPDSEVFYDFGTEHDPSYGEYCHPNCDCGRFMEIGNSVFMEYIKTENGFEKLPQQNVDFGGGLERIVAAAQDNPDVFCIDVFQTLISALQEATGARYMDNQKAFRIIADHMRAAIFLIADGVEPSNKDAGYFVRRLLRRAILQMHNLKEGVSVGMCVAPIAESYKEQYPNITKQQEEIRLSITAEETKFVVTLARGMREFEKRAGGVISGADAFTLFTTYGFPIELVIELAIERGMEVDVDGFREEMKKHQEQSRAGAEQKFKGGLADASEKTTMYHTATHLMFAGLRKYLGNDVHQKGANITQERTRFDFTYPEKVNREILDKVEQYVNEAIAKDMPVVIERMKKEEAREAGVEGSFWERYPDEVDVYLIQDEEGNVWSRELCGGPHVGRTSDIKGAFRIVKEEASSAGVRRVKAVLE